MGDRGKCSVSEKHYFEQRWSGSGESARLPSMWRGFDAGPVHLWVEFVVGSRLTPRVFLLVLRFSSLHKNEHLKIPVQPGQRTRVKTS